ncbi:hypothetical protein DFS34DRAFT_282591 [Phlyctochytrium arcticum]|nr:hypothetical protein DFS34DRAFT_282591 [Phlyctochytrium arcticum]
MQTVLVEFLRAGNVLVVDGIQENASLAEKIIRAIIEPSLNLRRTRLVLLGTPQETGSVDAVVFRPCTVNKINSHNIVLTPFNITEFIEVLDLAVGYVPAKEMVVLWAMTGGVARELRDVLKSCLEQDDRRRCQPFHRTSLVKYLRDQRDKMYMDLDDEEWLLLQKLNTAAGSSLRPPASKRLNPS